MWGGGRILDFRRNTNPSHLALTSTRNWPKSLSIFSNHVKRKTQLLEIERIAKEGWVGGCTSAWGRRMTSIRLDLSLDRSSANVPPACASLVYCTCTWQSACRHFQEFSTADNVQRARQCAPVVPRPPRKWASYQNIVHCWPAWVLEGAHRPSVEAQFAWFYCQIWLN